MGHLDLLEALWEHVPPGTEPEGFAWRRDWLLARVARGERVLDLGCGEGHFASALRAHGVHVVAADVVREPLRRAALRDPALELRLLALDAPLVFDDTSFDGVWAGEVVEHVVDVQGWLSEVRRVLSSGGWLALTTPDLDAAALGDPAARDEVLNPRSDHIRFFSARTLLDMVTAAGFDDASCASRDGTLLCTATRARF